jgi:hypothetical protein
LRTREEALAELVRRRHAQGTKGVERAMLDRMIRQLQAEIDTRRSLAHARQHLSRERPRLTIVSAQGADAIVDGPDAVRRRSARR